MKKLSLALGTGILAAVFCTTPALAGNSKFADNAGRESGYAVSHMRHQHRPRYEQQHQLHRYGDYRVRGPAGFSEDNRFRDRFGYWPRPHRHYRQHQWHDYRDHYAPRHCRQDHGDRNVSWVIQYGYYH